MARPASDIQPRIVHAARAQFLAFGVDGASLRAIARDAKTSIGMIYYYFPTKDDLFLAVVEEVYVGLLDGMTRALGPDLPVRERLERFYIRIGSMSPVELETLTLVAKEALGSSERLERLLERFQRGHLPLVLSTLADGVQDGTLNAELSPVLLFLSTMALGSIPQFVRRRAGNRPPFTGLPEGEVFARALVSILFSGIGAEKRRPAATKKQIQKQKKGASSSRHEK